MKFGWLTEARLREVAALKAQDRAERRERPPTSDERPEVVVTDWRPRAEEEGSLGDECR